MFKKYKYSWIIILIISCLVTLPVIAIAENTVENCSGAISARWLKSLALNNGVVWEWGKLMLGSGSFQDRFLPGHVLGESGNTYLDGVKAVSAGDPHNIALKNNGTVLAWGYNQHDALGVPVDTSIGFGTVMPILVGGEEGHGFLNQIKAISANFAYNLALKNDGTVMSWGFNERGKLGRETVDTSTNIPGLVVGVDGEGVLGGSGAKVIAVSAGVDSAMALMDNGTVMAWGWNAYGLLGNGDETIEGSNTPVLVGGVNENGIPALQNVIAISAGAGHNLVLKSDGTVWAWGWNEHGELGKGYESYENPVYTDLGGC